MRCEDQESTETTVAGRSVGDSNSDSIIDSDAYRLSLALCNAARFTRPKTAPPLVATLTTEGAAVLCEVAARTVVEWCDSDILKHYRLPMSKHRRVARYDLIQFLRDRGFAEVIVNRAINSNPDEVKVK